MLKKLYELFSSRLFAKKETTIEEQKTLLVQAYSTVEEYRQDNRNLYTEIGNIQSNIKTLEYLIRKSYEKNEPKESQLKDLALLRKELEAKKLFVEKNDQQIKAYEQKIEIYRKSTEDLNYKIKHNKLKSKLATWNKDALENQNALENISSEEKLNASTKEAEVAATDFTSPDDQVSLEYEIEKIKEEFNDQQKKPTL